MKILALDPGGTTGWAMYNNDVFTCGQLGPEPHHLQLYEFIGIEHVSDFHLVCESFEFRQHAQSVRNNINLISKEYIGICRLFGQEFPNIPVVFQTAAQAKPFVTDEKLKVMGLYTPGMKHARDANRHLVYYLVNRLRRHDLIKSWRNLA